MASDTQHAAAVALDATGFRLRLRALHELDRAPEFPQSMGGAIPMPAAAATAEVVASPGVTATLKWPNDVLIGTKKLSGILCEAQGGASAWTAIVGIGLNLRTPSDGWPAEIPAIALDQLTETTPEPRYSLGN